MMDLLLHDLRFGLRMLAKSPVVSLVAVLSLALGIGANTTIFTIINAIFLTPIPIADPSRVARVYTIDWENPTALTSVAFPNYEDYRDENTVFSGLASFRPFAVNLMPDDGEPRQITATLVTQNFFDVLGVEPFLGRFFRPEEDVAAIPVVVLSHGIWLRQWAGDPGVLGRKTSIQGIPFDIVGVAPAGFKGLQTIGDPDLVWMPMAMRGQVLTGLLGQYFDLRRARFSQVVGRLKDGVTVEQADQEIATISARLEEMYPTDNRGRVGAVRLYSPVSPNQGAQYSRVGLFMMVVVGVVLLIACANVANLLLARAADREKEIGIRVAIGADRGRLLRQLLTESLLLSLAAGGGGIAVAWWGRSALWAFRPPGFGERSVDLQLDARVLLFTVAVALATGVLFGLVPALQASNPNLKETLQEGGRTGDTGSGRALLRRGLVVSEVALALVSLVTAGLFIRSMRNAERVDPGFESERLALIRLNIGNAGYTRERGLQFYRALLEDIAALPAVDAASLQSGRLLGGGLPHTTFPEGVDIAGGRGLHVQDIVVTPSYFETVGLSLRDGRLLNEFDRDGTTRVAVVNEATRELFWPNESPVGRRFTRTVENFPIEVVGVVDNALIDLGEPAQPIIYTALEQFYQSSVQLHVRTRDDPIAAIAGVRDVIRALDPNLPLLGVSTIGDDISQALWAPRMGMALLSLFGALALLLAVVGIYGVTSYSVRQRYHELGLRAALGAGDADLLRLVLRQGMSLVGLGVVVGILVAVGATRLAMTMLWGVNPTDPLTFAIVAIVLVAVALIANLIPALRATRVDPVSVMRG